MNAGTAVSEATVIQAPPRPRRARAGQTKPSASRQVGFVRWIEVAGLVAASGLTLQVLPEGLSVPCGARRRGYAGEDRQGEKSGYEGLHDGTPLIGRADNTIVAVRQPLQAYAHHAGA